VASLATNGKDVDFLSPICHHYSSKRHLLCHRVEGRSSGLSYPRDTPPDLSDSYNDWLELSSRREASRASHLFLLSLGLISDWQQRDGQAVTKPILGVTRLVKS